MEIYQYVQSAALGQSFEALEREVPGPGVKEGEPERPVWVWEIPQDLVYGFFSSTGIVMKPFPRTIDSGYSLPQDID